MASLGRLPEFRKQLAELRRRLDELEAGGRDHSDREPLP
jgi:hypothetical protein